MKSAHLITACLIVYATAVKDLNAHNTELKAKVAELNTKLVELSVHIRATQMVVAASPLESQNELRAKVEAPVLATCTERKFSNSKDCQSLGDTAHTQVRPGDGLLSRSARHILEQASHELTQGMQVLAQESPSLVQQEDSLGESNRSGSVPQAVSTLKKKLKELKVALKPAIVKPKQNVAAIANANAKATGITELPLTGKPTAQSSTASGGQSSRAVDGNTNTQYSGNSCTHTSTDNPAWWSVDLQAQEAVKTVTVWNRGDCCGSRLNGFQVKVGNSDQQAQASLCGGSNSISQGESKDVDCAHTSPGRWVFVVVPRSVFLTLCEVKVSTSGAGGRKAPSPPSERQKRKNKGTTAVAGGSPKWGFDLMEGFLGSRKFMYRFKRRGHWRRDTTRHILQFWRTISVRAPGVKRECAKLIQGGDPRRTYKSWVRALTRGKALNFYKNKSQAQLLRVLAAGAFSVCTVQMTHLKRVSAGFMSLSYAKHLKKKGRAAQPLIAFDLYMPNMKKVMFCESKDPRGVSGNAVCSVRKKSGPITVRITRFKSSWHVGKQRSQRGMVYCTCSGKSTRGIGDFNKYVRLGRKFCRWNGRMPNPNPNPP